MYKRSLRLQELFLILTPTKLHIWPKLGIELQLIDLLGWDLMTQRPSLTKKIPLRFLSGVDFLPFDSQFRIG